MLRVPELQLLIGHMPKALVVVESPAKAKTINKYLGADFKVMASVGHIIDLPKSTLGVVIDGDEFKPVYEPIPGKQKIIKELRAAAKGVEQIYVATDPDREGEAIGWHLANELGAKNRKIGRLLFNEITKKAVLAALKEERSIDKRMVDAQQARRVLDRLVGYKLSPLLWEKVRRGLSAGRVQSVALKLVCDREAEIDRFEAKEYWHIFGQLAGSVPPEFTAKVIKKGTKTLNVTNEAEATSVVSDLKQADFTVRSIATKERKKKAPPPFITSKLQQAARFPVKKTMQIAQQLYEGVELPGEGSVGLITYMRTDSTRVGEEAISDVRDYILESHGEGFVPSKPHYFARKADAQDAHEAIRPTRVQYSPDSIRAHLTRDQYSLYRLIWNRFMASQMAPARFDDTTLEVEAGDYTLRTKGSVQTFAGWLALYQSETLTVGGSREASPGSEGTGESDEGTTDDVLPQLVVGEQLELRNLDPQQKYTQPPPRFSEATLVKELEENGIGRPSTYAAIIGKLQAQDYTEKLENRFHPTQLGRLVIKLLGSSFDDILAVAYTSELEEQLDKIEAGSADWQATLKIFYEKFSKELEVAFKEMPSVKGSGLPSDEVCDKCSEPMVFKVGKFGVFLACSAYPDCQNTRELSAGPVPETEPDPCENCGKPMVIKRGQFGQFLACSGYPDCKTTRKLIETSGGLAAAKPDQLLDEKCPKCSSNLVVKQGKNGEFTSCSGYPKCRYIKLKSTGVSCPEDGGEIVERKSKRGRTFYGCHNYPECDFTLWNRPLAEACPACGAPFVIEKITKRRGHQVLCNKDDCDYERTEEAVSA